MGKRNLVPVLLAGVILVLSGCGNISIETDTPDDESFNVYPDEDPSAKEKEEMAKTPRRSDRVNADEYFAENGTVLETVSVQDSSMQSEKQAIEFLEERGFKTESLSYSYDHTGKFLGDKKADSSSDALHPTYQMYHMTESGHRFFTISLINGQITALPVSYNLSSGGDVKTLFSESAELYSFDSATNQFYKTTPNKNVLDVQVIGRIDAASLEELAEKGF